MSDGAADLKVTVERAGAEAVRCAWRPEDPSKEVLLIGLERLGARLPYGCRAGACGSCLVWVRDGEACLSEADPIERDTLDRCRKGPQSRLACRVKARAGARGEVLVEVPPADESSDSIV